MSGILEKVENGLVLRSTREARVIIDELVLILKGKELETDKLKQDLKDSLHFEFKSGF